MNQRKGYLLVFIAGVLWGSIGIFIKIICSYNVSPSLCGFLRMLFAFLILLVYGIMKNGVGSLRLSRSTLIYSILLGIISHGIYNVFYNIAVEETGIAISAVLLNCSIATTGIMSVICLHERMTTGKFIAIILCIIGCTLVASKGSLDLESLSIIGIACGILAGIFYGLASIFVKLAVEDANAITISIYSYAIAAFLLFFISDPVANIDVINGKVLFASFLFALIPTAIAYLIYYMGVQLMTETSKVPIVASIEAVVASTAGIIIYHEELNLIMIIGIMLIFTSLLITSRRPALPDA